MNPKKGHVRYQRRIPKEWVVLMDAHLEKLKAAAGLPVKKPAPITFYESPHYYLSNFSSFGVWYDGEYFATSEHAYQAAKFSLSCDYALKTLIKNRSSAHSAMKTAREHKESYRRDWEQVKVKIMEDICRHKLDQHVYIQRKLLETGGRMLIESSPTDSFWGWGADKKGQNHLGKIWMKLRAELRHGVAYGETEVKP